MNFRFVMLRVERDNNVGGEDSSLPRWRIWLCQEARPVGALEVKQLSCFGLVPVIRAHGLLLDVSILDMTPDICNLP